jgi:acyl-CoA thioesterase I
MLKLAFICAGITLIVVAVLVAGSGRDAAIHTIMGESLWHDSIALASTPRPARVVFIGDSITQGYPDYDQRYTRWIMERLPGFSIINRGINGNHTTQMVDRFTRDVLADMPDIVFILAGTNDPYFDLPVETTMQNIRQMIAMAQESGASVILCTVPPQGGVRPHCVQRTADINQRITALAAREGLPLIDLFTAMAKTDNPDILNPDYTGDMLHPNTAGNQRIAQMAVPVIMRVAASRAR